MIDGDNHSLMFGLKMMSTFRLATIPDEVMEMNAQFSGNYRKG